MPLAAERFITVSDPAKNRMAGAAMTGSERTMILPYSVRSAGRQKMRFRFGLNEYPRMHL